MEPEGPSPFFAITPEDAPHTESHIEKKSLGNWSPREIMPP
jgi:hypothetical protein